MLDRIFLIDIILKIEGPIAKKIQGQNSKVFNTPKLKRVKGRIEK